MLQGSFLAGSLLTIYFSPIIMEYKEEPVSGLSLGELDPFGPAMGSFLLSAYMSQ